MTIDRRSLVRRHHPHFGSWDPLNALSLGNGEFAFTADVTGLQTFSDLHERPSSPSGAAAMPLGTQAQWGFHWSPNPNGWTIEDTERPLRGPRGEFPYPVDYDFELDAARSEAAGMSAGYYFWTNPQRLHLGRLALDLVDGPIGPDDLGDIDQELDLWAGVLRSSFTLRGHAVRVTTVCHPRLDAVAVRVESEAVASGRLGVALEFPTVAATFEAEPVWDAPGSHRTDVEHDGRTTWLHRTIDDAGYAVGVTTSRESELRRDGEHRFRVVASSPEARALEVVAWFASERPEGAPPAFEETRLAAAAAWERWWSTGAAVDLSSARDPRAPELERRIVLSQYQTAVHCAGSTPPQETGLVCNSWGGTFHLEMHWWHAAHFAAWGRPEMLERSLSWYERILPQARRTAQRHGLAGAQWPKHVGPEAVESPNSIGPLLVWQQPHPIHFAELVRRARGDDPEVLERYAEIVEETAECLVSLLVVDDEGVAHLAPPLVPAQEVYDLDTVWDPTFEIAAVRWALVVSNEWRRARGVEPDAHRASLADTLVPPVSESGRYDAVQRPPRTSTRDHPSLIGALGVIPDSGAIDREALRRTLDHVVDEWDWSSAWGWDFPMLALCAARLGDAGLAFDLLLTEAEKNRYLGSGHNFQDTRLPLYLPGNGGLLMAVSLLAGGWTSPDGTAIAPPSAPGWELSAEGFPSRP